MLRDGGQVHGPSSVVAMVEVGFLKEAVIWHLNRHIHNIVRWGSAACREAANYRDPYGRSDWHGLLCREIEDVCDPMSRYAGEKGRTQTDNTQPEFE